jgi:hypothetical protein
MGRAVAVAVLVLAGVAQAQTTAVERYAGTYEGTADGEQIHVRIGADRILTLITLADGAVATVNLEDAGALGLVGVSARGALVGITGDRARPSLVVGPQTVSLRPIPPEQFGRAPGAGSTPGAGAGPAPPGPPAPPPVDPSVARSPWAGTRLTNAETRSGYGESRLLVLCADGSYLYRFESQSISQLGTHADRQTDEGTWATRVQGTDTVVVLRPQTGETTELVLTPVADDVVSVSGRRYLIERVRC